MEVAPVRLTPVIVMASFPAIRPNHGVTSTIPGIPKYVKPFGRLAVPPNVVTETIIGSPTPDGVTAVIVVGFTTVTELAAAPPNVTELAPVRFVPVMVITVPPLNGPPVGTTDVMVGTGAYVKAFASVAVPAGVVTDTPLGPSVPMGVTAVTLLAFTTVTPVAGAPPMATALVAVKFVPVMVIELPPFMDPLPGVTAEMVGTSK
jgi:hypothetical protein